MNRMFALAALLLLIAAGPAGAQQAPAQPEQQKQQKPQEVPAAAEQQAAVRDIGPNVLAGAALQILQAIDRQRTGMLWDGASAAVKRVTQREEFVTRVITARKPLGAVVGRNWISVRRQQVADGDAPPAGLYGSVEFASQYEDGKTHRELVSMRHDEDGIWRFAGYVVE